MSKIKNFFHAIRVAFSEPYAHMHKLFEETPGNENDGVVNFKRGNKTIYAVKQSDLKKCIDDFESILHKANNFNFNQTYAAVSGECSAVFQPIVDNGKYGFYLKMEYLNNTLFEVHVSAEKTLVTILGIQVEDDRIQSLPRCVRIDIWSLRNYYGHGIVYYKLGIPDYVSMAADRKNVIFYAECVTKHKYIDFIKTEHIPLADLRNAIELVVKKFENFEPDKPISNNDYFEEEYTATSNDVTCRIDTRFVKNWNHYSLMLKISSHGYPFCVGDDYYRRMRYKREKSKEQYDKTNFFHIEILNSRMDDPSLSRVLPFIKEKYSYLEMLFELTKDNRFQRPLQTNT